MKTRTYNPLDLHIGQIVQIDQYCEVVYVDKQKQVVKIKAKESVTRIIGVIKKALGEYIPGNYNSSYGLDPGEYEQPTLAVSKYIWLYQTRTSIKAPIKLVHPEDILTAI